MNLGSDTGVLTRCMLRPWQYSEASGVPYLTDRPEALDFAAYDAGAACLQPVPEAGGGH